MESIGMSGKNNAGYRDVMFQMRDEDLKLIDQLGDRLEKMGISVPRRMGAYNRSAILRYIVKMAQDMPLETNQSREILQQRVAELEEYLHDLTARVDRIEQNHE